MPSSRPSIRSDVAGYRPCPTCGSSRVVAVPEDVTLRIGPQPLRLERVPHAHRLAGGERVVIVEASQRFDAAAPPRRQSTLRQWTVARHRYYA